MFIPIGYLFSKKYSKIYLKQTVMFTLFEGLWTKFILHQIHNFTFIFRRIIIVSIVCGLLGKFTSSLTLLIISHAIYAIYTIVLWPYDELFVNIFDFCCDSMVTIYYICVASFGSEYSESNAKGLIMFMISA